MSHRHPLLAALYDRVTESGERAFLGGLRREFVAAAKGFVLEIGAGTGRNFPYYSAASVDEVLAVEPDPEMRRRGEARRQAAALRISLLDGMAERLPFESACADTVVTTLVLCSVDDPRQVVREIRRVLKPGGTLILIEHIRTEDRWTTRFQDLLTPLWRRIAGNCHLNRPTLDTLRDAGFKIQGGESVVVGSPKILPIVAGFGSMSGKKPLGRFQSFLEYFSISASKNRCLVPV
ncbi:MAG TPA: class I SAM-dependent methyltransferase [Myxococcota bacterium]|nr:class I SAM-dependent methyltransferase [Myxococcota bacterium]